MATATQDQRIRKSLSRQSKVWLRLFFYVFPSDALQVHRITSSSVSRIHAGQDYLMQQLFLFLFLPIPSDCADHIIGLQNINVFMLIAYVSTSEARNLQDIREYRATCVDHL